MTATYNPQAAADQARAAYRDTTAQLGHLGLDTAIPEGVRALPEKAVTQTRQVYDRSKDAFDASLTTFERSFDAPAKALPRSTARSSTSPGATLIQASTWLRA
jgi:hypothetical protein